MLPAAPRPRAVVRPIPPEGIAVSVRNRIALVVCLMVFAAGPAGAQNPPPAPPAAAVVKLRNVAAVDAAKALADFTAANGLGVKVVAEPVSNTVLVSGPAEQFQRAVAMLEALDRNPTGVVVEVRYLRVPVGLCHSLGLKPTGDGVAPLTENEVRTLHESAHGFKECQVLQAPKLCLFDNQPGTVDDTTRHTFVTGVEAQNVNGEVVFVPQNKVVTVGDSLTACGRVSPDERSVNLRLSLHRSRIVGDVPMVPVVTQITPVFEGGSRGKPVPFTQFVQAPRVHTTNVERTVMVPTGGTAVVGVWTEPAEDAGAGKTGAGLATLHKPAAPPKRAECEVIMLATVHVVRD